MSSAVVPAAAAAAALISTNVDFAPFSCRSSGKIDIMLTLERKRRYPLMALTAVYHSSTQRSDGIRTNSRSLAIDMKLQFASRQVKSFGLMVPFLVAIIQT